MSARELLTLIEAQANDSGLWFDAEHLPEAYLQNALRKLHAAVESHLASLEPVAMPPEPLPSERWVRSTDEWVSVEAYNRLRAWAARGELSEARIREIAGEHTPIVDTRYGERLALERNVIAAIRQALGESKP